MFRRVILVALSLICSPCCGQIAITGPATSSVGAPIELEVTGLPPIDFAKPLAESLEWVDDLKIVANAPVGCTCDLKSDLRLDFLSKSWRLVVSTTPSAAGVLVVAADWNGTDPSLSLHRITVGGITPVPVPPGPTPDPTPPVPPQPPVPSDGFRVMILEETADRASLKPSQLAAMHSPAVRAYLDSRAKLPNGERGWRIWDDDYTDAQLADENVEIVAIYKRAQIDRKSTPWIYVANNGIGESVPLPPDEASLMALLRKYGG